MDRTQLVPACVFALEHEPDLRAQILAIAPEAGAAAGKLASLGSRHTDGLVTRDFHLAVAALNQRIPELWVLAQTCPAEIDRCASAHRAEVARHRATRRDVPVPPLRNQAKNFAKAVVAEAASVAKGVKPVTPDEKRARLAICAACPQRVVQDGNARCAVCGCFLERKTAWRSQSCPLGKWASLVDTRPRA